MILAASRLTDQTKTTEMDWHWTLFSIFAFNFWTRSHSKEQLFKSQLAGPWVNLKFKISFPAVCLSSLRSRSEMTNRNTQTKSLSQFLFSPSYEQPAPCIKQLKVVVLRAKSTRKKSPYRSIISILIFLISRGKFMVLQLNYKLTCSRFSTFIIRSLFTKSSANCSSTYPNTLPSNNTG